MRDPVYGHEFRQARRSRQLTQVALAKALGVSQSYIAQIEAGRNYPSATLVPRIVEVLGLGPPSENKVAAGLAEMADRFTRESRRAVTPDRVRLPIVGAPVPGDEERMTIDGQPHGFILAPPQLERVPGAQALYVRGRSMEPRYYPGELVYLNPARPPNPGDFVLVLVREPQFAAPIGYVRQYLGEDARGARLTTLNPKHDYTVDRKALVSIVTIVGSGLL
jgi:phage repressor protein C with HTH and peptisase S24 domain